MAGQEENALNDQQRRAAMFGDGPLLIIAGAGTGKTKTLAHRVAHLIGSGVAPERILLLTFSRRASREMLSRAARIVGETQTTRVWGGTFHAVANRLLRIYGRALRLPAEFTIMDQADAADLMNLIRNDLGLGQGPRRFPRKDTLADIYSRVVNARQKLADVLEASFPWCAGEADRIRAVFRAYIARKREQAVLDYDDLLLYWHALTRADKTGETVVGLFDHILVDEYQDTNIAQLDILREMRRSNPNITVVGDDAQAIYSFRAATIRNILDFAEHFPGAEVVRLEQNYRSTPPILELTNAVMDPAPEKHAKRLWSERPAGPLPRLVTCLDETRQADVVCKEVLDQREQGVALRQQAVLFRTGHHSDLLEVELARRNIPFVKYGGLKFIETAHVKDLLALLRILENPMDEMSWFRALQLVNGIGPSHARQLIADLGVRRGPDGSPDAVPVELRRAESPLRTLQSEALAAPPGSSEHFDAFRWTMREAEDLPPAAQIERLRQFYEPVLERLHDNAEARIRDLQQLEHIASGYATRREFITDLTLDPPSASSDFAGPPLLDDDYLILSTIHSAKGCEWTSVHVIHAADGMIPSDMATKTQEDIEEERRLFYVALTRAKDRLSIYFPLRYYYRRNGRGDAHSFAKLTRFLTPEAKALMEHDVLYDHSGEVQEPLAVPAASRSVDRLLEGLLQD
ncbi:MAG: ATP-dependent helicase [Chloroflexota bacterium]